MVNAATVEKCKNLKFLGYFLNAVNGNQQCSNFGNSECSIFGIKTTVLLASAVQ